MRTYTKLSHLVVFIVALLLIGCSASNSGASGSQYISVNGGSQLSESNPFALNLQSTSNQVTQSNVPLNSTLNLDFYSALDLKKINKDGGVSKYIQLKSQLGTLTTYKDSYISQNNKNIVLNTDKLATNTNYKLMVNYLPLANGGYITGFISFGSGATNPLTVTMLSPKNNESNISTNPTISFTFNQIALNVNTDNVKLYKTSVSPANLESITSLIQDALGNYSFTTLKPLTKNTNYYIVFGNGITDASGNPLQATNFTFNTIDNTAPKAFLLSPSINQRKVSLTPIFAVLFSESVAGVESGVFVKDVNGNAITLTGFDYTGNVLSFNNLKPLNSNAVYSITLESSITDLSGNHLDQYTYYFTTGESMVTTAYLLNPVPNSVGNSNSIKYKVRFSNYMDSSISLKNNFSLKTKSGTLINIAGLSVESNSPNIYSFTSDRLFSNTQYELSISNTIDYLKNKIADTIFNFTTGQSQAVTVTMISPANGSYIASGLINNVVLKFSESMQTYDAGYLLACRKYPNLYGTFDCGTPAGNFVLSADRQTLTYNLFYPTSIYANENFSINLPALKNRGVSGNYLESTSFNFSTGNPRPLTASIISPDISKAVYPLTIGSSIDIEFPDFIRNFLIIESGVCAQPYYWINSTSITLKEADTGKIIQTFFAESCVSTKIFKMILKENLKSNTKYFISFAREILSEAINLLTPTTVSFATGTPTNFVVTPYNFSGGQEGLGSGFIPGLSFNQAVDNFATTDLDFKNSSGSSIGFQTLKSNSTIWYIKPNNLLPDGWYSLTVKNTLKSVYGTNLPSSIIYTFRIQSAPPVVSGVTPSNNSTSVDLNTNFTVYFNQNVTGQCNYNAYSLTANGSPISFLVNCTASSATIIPSTHSNLTTYQLTIKSGTITNTAGTSYVPQYVSSFTTIPGSDTARPTVWWSTPNNASSFSSSIFRDYLSIYFSEPVRGVSSSTLFLERCSNYTGSSYNAGTCNTFSGDRLNTSIVYKGPGYYDTSEYYNISILSSPSSLIKGAFYCLRVPNLSSITDNSLNPLNYDNTQCIQYLGF